jgi:hypothetical protein
LWAHGITAYWAAQRQRDSRCLGSWAYYGGGADHGHGKRRHPDPAHPQVFRHVKHLIAKIRIEIDPIDCI